MQNIRSQLVNFITTQFCSSQVIGGDRDIVPDLLIPKHSMSWIHTFDQKTMINIKDFRFYKLLFERLESSSLVELVSFLQVFCICTFSWICTSTHRYVLICLYNGIGYPVYIFFSLGNLTKIYIWYPEFTFHEIYSRSWYIFVWINTLQYVRGRPAMTSRIRTISTYP